MIRQESWAFTEIAEKLKPGEQLSTSTFPTVLYYLLDKNVGFKTTTMKIYIRHGPSRNNSLAVY